MLDVHGRGGNSSRIIEMRDGGATIVRGGLCGDMNELICRVNWSCEGSGCCSSDRGGSI
jgi:hypothetical protein